MGRSLFFKGCDHTSYPDRETQLQFMQNNQKTVGAKIIIIVVWSHVTCCAQKCVWSVEPSTFSKGRCLWLALGSLLVKKARNLCCVQLHQKTLPFEALSVTVKAHHVANSRVSSQRSPDRTSFAVQGCRCFGYHRLASLMLAIQIALNKSSVASVVLNATIPTMWRAARLRTTQKRADTSPACVGVALEVIVHHRGVYISDRNWTWP